MQEEGWNVASGKRIVKNAAAKQPHATKKSTSGNRFEVLQNDKKEIETPYDKMEEALYPEQEAIAEDLTQQKMKDP